MATQSLPSPHDPPTPSQSESEKAKPADPETSPKSCEHCEFLAHRTGGHDSSFARYGHSRDPKSGEHEPTLQCPGFEVFGSMDIKSAPWNNYRETGYALLLADKTARWLDTMEVYLAICRDKEKHKLMAWEFALMEATDLAWALVSKLKVYADICGGPHEGEGF